MKSRFQDLVQEASLPPRAIRISTGGLFVGLSTESDIWGQKPNQFKPEDDAEPWKANEPTDHAKDAKPRHNDEAPENDSPVNTVVIDEDLITAELNLTSDMNVRELQTLRRDFARRNHPDAVSEDRTLCENRMKIANRIIDDHIRLKSNS